MEYLVKIMNCSVILSVKENNKAKQISILIGVMIIRISYNYAVQCNKAHLSDVCDDIVHYRHYISCDFKTQKYLLKVIDENGSKTLRDAIRSTAGPFDTLTKLQQTNMRVVNLDDDLIASNALSKPSVIILENAPYEWDIYKCMAESYKHDPKFGSLFSQLALYMKNKLLNVYHGGGWCQQKEHVLLHEQNMGYKNCGKIKLFCQMDSDSTSEGDIPSDKKKVCNFLCGTTDVPLNKLPIYTLKQSYYTWHMWYKRAIENYFPNSAYEKFGMNTSKLPHVQIQRDYVSINKDFVEGYSKDRLKELPTIMSRKDYELGLKHFNINGEDYSEIQLFLLKLVYMI